MNLTVVTSAVGQSEGYFYPTQDTCFKLIELKKISFKFLGMKCVVLRKLMHTIFSIRPTVVITTGNKSFIQNFLILLAKKVIRYRLYYFQHAKNYENNHHISNAIIDFYQKIICRFADGLILYTENEAINLIKKGYPSQKIFYVNNTIDTLEIISKNYKDNEKEEIFKKYKIKDCPLILFIGRLVDGKEVDLLFNYYYELRKFIKDLQLIVIGGGNNFERLNKKYKNDGVVFTGPLYNEMEIFYIMKAAKFIFNPGYTGLNIMHAFSYGKPFVTFESENHKPEICYLKDGVNGKILEKHSKEKNISFLLGLINDKKISEVMGANGLKVAKKYSIENMANNFIKIIKK